MPPQAELATVSDIELRERAAEILTRPEYARFRTVPAELLRELLDLFSAWLAWLAELHERSPLLYFCVLFGLIALVAALSTHLVWSLRAALRMPPPEPEPAARGERDFVAEARGLAQSGDYLEASHRLLLASLAHAARSRLLELHPDDGNQAVRRKLHAAALEPDLKQRWSALIARTDALWFGSRAQNAELYEDWRGVYAELTGGAP
jgi:hypothetical protein